jgi:hypothetical protein
LPRICCMRRDFMPRYILQGACRDALSAGWRSLNGFGIGIGQFFTALASCLARPACSREGRGRTFNPHLARKVPLKTARTLGEPTVTGSDVILSGRMPLPFSLLDRRGGGVRGCEKLHSLAPHLQFPLHQRRDLGRSGKTINSLAPSSKPRAGNHATDRADTAADWTPIRERRRSGVRGSTTPLAPHLFQRRKIIVHPRSRKRVRAGPPHGGHPSKCSAKPA